MVILAEMRLAKFKFNEDLLIILRFARVEVTVCFRLTHAFTRLLVINLGSTQK